MATAFIGGQLDRLGRITGPPAIKGDPRLVGGAVRLDGFRPGTGYLFESTPLPGEPRGFVHACVGYNKPTENITVWGAGNMPLAIGSNEDARQVYPTIGVREIAETAGALTIINWTPPAGRPPTGA
ncbi:MAG TPA: hypothetical protein VLH84_05815 [Patescibacteria group bacterium]|nr:hypothetical protein [Patescibacteria group bacterium]